MFQKLLVPLDGTAQAAAALPLARAIAHATSGSLVLMRVADKSDRSGEPERYLQGVGRELAESNCETLVRHGTPATEIVGAARDSGADLIVMTTHGRSGVQRVLLGSVAQRVLSHAEVPLVLLRPGGKRVTQLQTLIAPTDGTAGATLALGTAVGLARTANARLLLVQAITPIPIWASGSEYGAAQSYVDPGWEDEALSAGTAYVQGLAARLQAAGANAESRVLKGQAVDIIQQVADETDADLIVMSTHALTGPARTLLGSTADALVRGSHRPVLLVRRPKDMLDSDDAAEHVDITNGG